MSAFQKWLLLGSSAATAVTGLAYAWMKYLMEPADPWAVINHPLEPWMLKAHILVAPVLVFAFGLIAVDHVWKHFRCRVPMGRRSGIAAALVFFPMVVSGYLIQAVTHAGWLRALVVAHLVTGVVFALGLTLHTRLFRGRINGRKQRPEEVPEVGDEPMRGVPGGPAGGRRERRPLIEAGEGGARIVLPEDPLGGRPGGRHRDLQASLPDGDRTS